MLRYSNLFYSILFYSILFYSILFYSNLSYSTLLILPMTLHTDIFKSIYMCARLAQLVRWSSLLGCLFICLFVLWQQSVFVAPARFSDSQPNLGYQEKSNTYIFVIIVAKIDKI